MAIVLGPESSKPPPGWRPDMGADVNRGLMGWWPFNEGTGSVLTDISGCNHHGVLAGNPAWTGGPRGSVLNLDGTDRAVVTSTSRLDVLTEVDQLSVAFWARPTGSLGSDMRCVTRWTPNAGSGNQFMVWMDAGGGGAGWAIVLGATVAGDGNANATLDVWQHVAATCDGVTVNTYVDGVLQGDSASAPGFTTSSRNIHIGTLGTSAGLVGDMDDLRIWSRGITAAEVRQVYEQPYG